MRLVFAGGRNELQAVMAFNETTSMPALSFVDDEDLPLTTLPVISMRRVVRMPIIG